jgi:hypothetical protein
VRLTGASVSLYAVSGESTRGTIAERQTKHTPKMTIVQRRYFIQSPKLLLELRASEMLVNVKSVQRKAGRQLSRTSRRLKFLSCHSGPVIAGGPFFPRPVREEWEARMQIQPFLRRWPILLSVLCAKGWAPDSQSEAEQAALHARRAGHRVLDGESMRQLPAAYGHPPRPGITSREAAPFLAFLESAGGPVRRWSSL